MSRSLEPEAPRLLGTRTFTDDDQRRFAAESRDVNPMHMDPVAARRLLSGRQVVHGVHTLIQALDLGLPPAPPQGWSVQCHFAHPVSLGDRVEFHAVPASQGRHRLTAKVDGVVATDIVLRAADGAAPPVPFGGPWRSVGALATPLDEPPESWVGQTLEIESWPDRLAELYPRAAQALGRGALGDLARLSFVVGMVCPGLHSVFASLQFRCGAGTRADAPPGTPLRVQVTRHDPRFRMLFIAFQGSVNGELRAFVRPPPQAQPGSAELLGRADAGAWAGRRALVVGGSRGLGELAAKLLGAAGGHVTISHARGRDDALAVARDIEAAGAGRCDVVPWDLAASFAPPPGLDAAALDAVFYFATPRIFAKRAAAFQRDAFDTFVRFYLERFHELCLWLEGTGRPVRVYLPSTVYIGERPPGMAEYAMAKAAAEVLAEELNRSLRHVRIVHTRLPRLPTDQTAAVMALDSGDAVEAITGVLRLVRAALPG
ncbi:MAG: MaoC/PaaZ C-terminal domain-containing protein [Rubrivivax sp.]